MINVYTLDQHPEFKGEIERISREAWPAFMLHHKLVKPQWQDLFTTFAAFQFVLCEANRVLAAGNTIPLQWNGQLDELPTGWDSAFDKGFTDKGAACTVLSAVSVGVAPENRGRGLGRLLLETMKAIARRHQLERGLIATVRPTWKSRYPLIPFGDYINWTTNDGQPYDPWLALHQNMGAKRLRIELQSKKIEATCNRWEEWTGLRFAQDGDYIVRHALTPVHVVKNIGVYTEPNVWMHHTA